MTARDRCYANIRAEPWGKRGTTARPASRPNTRKSAKHSYPCWRCKVFQEPRPSSVSSIAVTSRPTNHQSLPRLVRPAIREQAVHEKLERVIEHDRQKNQTQVGARAENQDR
jgi:hypothetical protein